MGATKDQQERNVVSDSLLCWIAEDSLEAL